MTYERSLIELDDLVGPFWLVNKIVLSHLLLDCLFLVLVDFLWNIGLGSWEESWESISQE